MTSNAELRKRLAEQVMGWTFERYYPNGLTLRNTWLTDKGGHWPIADWHPDTDIAQAMMVAEKIGGLCLFHIKTENIWQAGFPPHQITADTPAMAICLCADAWLRQGGGWMSTFVSQDADNIIFDFKCECADCDAEGKLGLKKKDGMRAFNCPERCGAVYVPWEHDGKWKLQVVVMPVFEQPSEATDERVE